MTDHKVVGRAEWQAGPGFWALVSGGGAALVGVVHFGPAAVEPPALIVDHYDPPLLGWLASSGSATPRVTARSVRSPSRVAG
jgi:hypothetical protein